MSLSIVKKKRKRKKVHKTKIYHKKKMTLIVCKNKDN